MTAESPWAFVALLVACTITYIDIDNGFRIRRFGLALVLSHFPTLIFILANAGLTAGLVLWSLSDPAAAINEIIPADSNWAKTLTIALATPALLKSKLFQFKAGNDDIKFGPDYLYEWIRKRVLTDLVLYVGRKKSVATRALADQIIKKGAPGEIRALRDYIVKDYFDPLGDDGGKTAYEAQANAIDAKFPGVLESIEPVSAHLGLAFDTIGIKPTKDFINRS